MKHWLIAATTLLLMTACLHKKHGAVKEEIREQHVRMEAKTFALSVVQTYFEEDCAAFLAKFSESIMLVDGNGVFEVEGRQDKLCRSAKRAVLDKSKTLEDYLQTYEVEMLSRAELEERFEMTLPDYFDSDTSDYFFLGTELKEGFLKSDTFIWRDMFFFMVRRDADGQWKIKGVSG